MSIDGQAAPGWPGAHHLEGVITFASVEASSLACQGSGTFSAIFFTSVRWKRGVPSGNSALTASPVSS
jgi:hypothetical protein